MGKIGPFVGIGDEIGLVVGINPVVEIGLFGGTGLVVSLTYINIFWGLIENSIFLRQIEMVGAQWRSGRASVP